MEIWEIDDGDEAIEGLDERGRPDPAYAASLGLLPAPYGRRAAATAIDIAVYSVLQIPYWIFTLPLLIKLISGRISFYGYTNHPDFVLSLIMAAVSGVLTLVFVIVQLTLHATRGTTIGRTMTGVKSINVKTLGKPGFWPVALRALVLWGSSVLVIGPLIFFASILWDPQKRGRGWHDQAGKTWVVDTRNGLDPYDEKRLRIARKMVTAAPVAQHKALPSLATSESKDDNGIYRPGARVSAGVLGVAKPHGAGPRQVVGLTGVEEDKPPAAGGSLSSAAPPPPPVSTPVTPTAAPPSVPPVPAAPVSSPTPPTPPVRQQAPSPAPAPAPTPDPEPVPGPSAESARTSATVPPTSGLVLRLDSGEEIDVSEPLTLGRNPASVEGSRAVPIADDTQSVSKTHLSMRPSGLGVEVVDQHSTNGTFVVHAGEMTEALEPVLAMPGDTIRFGDRSAVLTPA